MTSEGCIYLPTHLPTFLPTHLPTFLPTHLPTYLLTYLPNYLSIFINLPTIYLSVCQSVCPSVCLFPYGGAPAGQLLVLLATRLVEGEHPGWHRERGSESERARESERGR